MQTSNLGSCFSTILRMLHQATLTDLRWYWSIVLSVVLEVGCQYCFCSPVFDHDFLVYSGRDDHLLQNDILLCCDSLSSNSWQLAEARFIYKVVVQTWVLFKILKNAQSCPLRSQGIVGSHLGKVCCRFSVSEGEWLYLCSNRRVNWLKSSLQLIVKMSIYMLGSFLLPPLYAKTPSTTSFHVTSSPSSHERVFQPLSSVLFWL
jgi:hypothetical protein